MPAPVPSSPPPSDDAEQGQGQEPGQGQGQGQSESRRARSQRSPAPGARLRDAEQSRARLLAAALDEFAAKGYAGARVSDIAARAGLNKQLITYYFGGKRGLYQALDEQWLDEEADATPPSMPLDELAAAYLQMTLADPRRSRLLLWEGLTGAVAQAGGTTSSPSAAPAAPSPNPAEDPAVADMHARQAQGELADDLDPALVLIAMMGMTLAPVSMPQVVWRSTGLDPAAPAFAERYTEQLVRIIRRLAVPVPTLEDQT